MTKDEELDQLRAEKTALYEALRRKDEELEQSHQANQDLREGLKQAIIAIGAGHERVNVLEGLIDALQERIKTLERHQAKDSHNSSLPPSSDRFVRAPKSLRTKSGKKPGGQPGHRGHHLQQVEIPDQILIHPVARCEHCQHDLRAQPAALPERRQVIDQDETTLRVGTTGWWVHVCSTKRLTHYAAHPSRGRTALNAIGIAPQFRGTSVHDGFRSYQGYGFTHAWCNVHHLRELTFVEEELKQAWARKMKALLLDMKAEVEQAKALGQHELEVLVLAPLLRRYDELLTEGYLANPPAPPPKKRPGGRPKQSPARNLLDRLCGGKWAVLRFLLDFAVPFDNNQAERDLRMIKVQQKVSGCFRTEQGVTMFCRIRSYLSTLRKQGIELFSALDHTLSGHPVFPVFT